MVRWAGFVGLLALTPACKSAGGQETCPPAPVDPPCADAPPSFAQDIYPQVFQPTCVRCHSPTGEEPKTPLTSYQQIYGSNGVTAKEIYYQVFQACLMPPPSAPEALSDIQRQRLLDWFACGAPNN